VLLATAEPAEPLAPHVDALLADQRRRWPRFRDGEAGLAGLRSVRLAVGDATVLVQANPGRRASVHADVEPAAVARRPCRLCADNLPPEERGIGFRDLVLMPNPYPVLRRHLTIASREHLPQRLNGRVEVFVELARALGPEMMVFYNGPRCGASSPDHFHFQSCDTAGVPLFDLPPPPERSGLAAWSLPARRALAFRHPDAAMVAGSVARALAALGRVAPGDDEPMLNAIALHRQGAFEVYLFPRARHRSSHYFAPAESRISVSPGTLEMAGILVLADDRHLGRVDAATARAILDQVSLDGGRFRRLTGELP